MFIRIAVCSWALLIMLIGDSTAQSQPCDKVVNIDNGSEVNCLYAIIGQDSCDSAASLPCPVGNRCDLIQKEDGSAAYSCWVEGTTHQDFGFDNLSPGSTAPRWSAPPSGLPGFSSKVTSAIACKRFYVCNCRKDDASDDRFCLSRECGLQILWTLAQTPRVSCYVE